MSKKDKIYHSFINEDGKKVSGTASYLHYISNQGGVEKHEKNIAMKAFEMFYDSVSETLRDSIAKEVKKNLFRLIKKEA